MISNKVQKAVHKFNGIPDWNNDLNSLWKSDKTRPWDTVYSREQFRRFWDVRYVEHRK